MAVRKDTYMDRLIDAIAALEAATEGLESNATIGEVADAVVAAGASGTLSAKQRRLTTDLAALLATEGAVADAIVAAGAAGSNSAKLRRVTQGLEDLKTLLSLAAGENNIGKVGGHGDTISKEFTRPSDTTPYTAKDAVGNTGAAALIQFDAVSRVASGSGYITAASIETDQKTNVSRFKLWLYQDNTPTPIADNGPFLQLYANNAVRIGSIEFDPMSTEDATNSTSARTQKTQIMLFFKADANSRIYGMLETLDGFTPASAQKFYCKLRVDQN